MNRRDVLQHVAVLMGGAISAPAILGVLNGCTARQSEAAWKPLFLNEAQAALVAEIAEIMIPRTDTPGAADLGVPEFIDKMLKLVYDGEGQARFISGLQAFEARARSQHGADFLKLEPQQRVRLVQEAHDADIVGERADDEPDRSSRRPFILMTKELTLLGFFTSQVGATQLQQYVPVPGAWHACIPLAQAGNGRPWTPESTARF